MKRLGIGYDVLPCESSILHLKFWDKAFELLKERRAIYLETEGENKGCWVMRLEEDEEREKVIVRSNGTVTYVGKDIAYQLWKFGLLGTRLLLRALLRGGRPDPLDLDRRTRRPGTPGFGGGDQGLQRHRHAPVLPAEGRRPGPARPQVRRPGRQVHPFLLRDGRPVAAEPAPSSATPPPTRRRTAPSSRSPAARVSASRPTTSSTGWRPKPGPRSRSGTRTDPRRRRGRSPGRSPPGPYATSCSSSPAIRSSSSTSRRP